MLGRKADQAGLIHYSQQLHTGEMTLEQVQDILLDSEEADRYLKRKTEAFFKDREFPEAENRAELFGKLRKIYLKTLRREPDEVAVLRYLTDLGNDKKDWDYIQHITAISEEAKNVLRKEREILFPDGEAGEVKDEL